MFTPRYYPLWQSGARPPADAPVTTGSDRPSRYDERGREASPPVDDYAYARVPAEALCPRARGSPMPACQRKPMPAEVKGATHRKPKVDSRFGFACQLDASNGTSWTISCGLKLAAYRVVTLPVALIPYTRPL